MLKGRRQPYVLLMLSDLKMLWRALVRQPNDAPPVRRDLHRYVLARSLKFRVMG
jgi:hypothetical protein